MPLNLIMRGKVLNAADINNILRTGKGFDQILSKVKILTAENGKLTAEFKVEEEHSNKKGGLHGGLSVSLVDNISGFALVSHPNGVVPSVSVNINVDFLKGAKIGDEVQIFADTVKIGKTLAFLEVFIKDKKTGALLVKGSQTKFLMKSQNTFYEADK